MLGEEGLDTVSAKPASMHIGKQRSRVAARRLTGPGLEDALHVRCQWCTPFLSTLADTPHMSSNAEVNGIPVEVDKFRKTQASLNREQQ
ncbi:hypothetical protein BTHE68_70620 (plasmid) [Burkholderia sp. THE68]|nr:hypothetical protein BTHE68_70620 [Burkholderia sp. THE68]